MKDVNQDTLILLGARASRVENQDAIDACIVGMLGDPKEVCIQENFNLCDISLILFFFFLKSRSFLWLWDLLRLLRSCCHYNPPHPTYNCSSMLSVKKFLDKLVGLMSFEHSRDL